MNAEHGLVNGIEVQSWRLILILNLIFNKSILVTNDIHNVVRIINMDFVSKKLHPEEAVHEDEEHYKEIEG